MLPYNRTLRMFPERGSRVGQRKAPILGDYGERLWTPDRTVLPNIPAHLPRSPSVPLIFAVDELKTSVVLYHQFGRNRPRPSGPIQPPRKELKKGVFPNADSLYRTYSIDRRKEPVSYFPCQVYIGHIVRIGFSSNLRRKASPRKSWTTFPKLGPSHASVLSVASQGREHLRASNMLKGAAVPKHSKHYLLPPKSLTNYITSRPPCQRKKHFFPPVCPSLTNHHVTRII